MNLTRYVTMDEIVDDIIDWGGLRNFLNLRSIKKRANSILRKLEVPENFQHKITLIDVEDYKADRPLDMLGIVQIAFKDDSPKKVKRTEIVEWTQKMYDGSGCELVIKKNCPNCNNSGPKGECSCDSPGIVYDVDRLWELSHPEFKYRHMGHYYAHGGLTNENQVVSPFHPNFVLMRPTSHDFFNADLHVPGCLNLNDRLMSSANYEYLIRDSIIEVNKIKGKILLAYLASNLDKNGFRMVPDNESVVDAIKWGVMEAYHYREINKSRTQQDRNHHRVMFREAEQRRIESMGRAYEELTEPAFGEWIEFLNENLFKIRKDYTQFYNPGVRTGDVSRRNLNRLTRQ